MTFIHHHSLSLSSSSSSIIIIRQSKSHIRCHGTANKTCGTEIPNDVQNFVY